MYGGLFNPQVPQHGWTLSRHPNSITGLFPGAGPPHTLRPETEPPFSPLSCPNIGLRPLQVGHLIKGRRGTRVRVPLVGSQSPCTLTSASDQTPGGAGCSVAQRHLPPRSVVIVMIRALGTPSRFIGSQASSVGVSTLRLQLIACTHHQDAPVPALTSTPSSDSDTMPPYASFMSVSCWLEWRPAMKRRVFLHLLCSRT